MKEKTFLPLRFILIGCTFLLTVLLYVDRACISAAKEEITGELGFSLTQFGWIMAMFTLGYALFQAPSGKLADRYGPRAVIGTIVALWSALTALTGVAWSYLSMLVIRLLFGAGEAGAFPALSKVVYTWFPLKERGIVQGINFSGSRLGAAFALPLVAWMISSLGWRASFFIFGALGIVFSVLWFLLFRNKPEESGALGLKEKKYILENRQQPSSVQTLKLPFSRIIASGNMWLTMGQYICSNFTFYFTLTWMFPFIREKFLLSPLEAGLYSSVPLMAGALGNWVSGLMVDYLYRTKGLEVSRRLPAILGFILASAGMLMVVFSPSGPMAIAFLALAVFGADMTLSPSWAFCIDVGKENAGVVSGTMNMAGNLGAFVTIIAFPYLFKWTGRYEPFFIICSILSLAAVGMWFKMNPRKPLTAEINQI
jgi:ACS family glucarate transporter-like MFS transporter